MNRKMVTIDGNEAAAYIAHKTNEICAIYPITPSSNMGELADAFTAQGQKNIWGTIPTVEAMQSEGGAAGAVHGALQTGALTTTFTASQGLLLMIPNMYKIAGELTATVFHVSARSLAAQALSIFGDHSDVMATRATGWAMLSSNSVQEVMDMALISQAATLQTRVPFIHFFDGFRTSHEVLKIEQLNDDDIKGMIDDEWVIAHRNRGMNPNDPVLRGTAQNPDVYFQGRETVNPYYEATPEIVQKTMDRFNSLVGRQYQLFDYMGAEDAERVIIIMGSGAETVEETIEQMNAAGEKVGLLKIRLFRPFSIKHFISALPASVKKIAVLDRTKEPGGAGEPMYQDVLTAFVEAKTEAYYQFENTPLVIGGRYGLSSKEFTPAMIKGIYDELIKDKPKNHFTIGIKDDISFTSLEYNPEYHTSSADVFRGLFYGLGSDGTVGANKNSIKIIGEGTDNYAQGYFVYDSKKSGSTTTSHLRFGKDKIRSPYLIDKANFIACHQYELLDQFDILAQAEVGATFLLNSHLNKDEIWGALPRHYQKRIIDKKLKFYVIDAVTVARETGMGMRINTIMQTCFFAISGILSKDESIAKIKEAIYKTYGKKGDAVVEKNYTAVDHSVSNLFQVDVPNTLNGSDALRLIVPEAAPDFVQKVTAEIIAGRGDDLPVSAMPNDGTWPTGTTQWEKRNIALEVPVWEPDICIQCNKCAMVCPHAAIRPKVTNEAAFENAPETIKHVNAKGREWEADSQYILQVAVEDCTGCNLCVEVCPARDKTNLSRKAINMAEQRPLRESERANWDFFTDLPEVDRNLIKHETVKGAQFLQPLFEFSGACVGCGETPYVKLVSQLFGDRMIVANATGCSSIYGGNLPTTPWSKNNDGRGPTWNNSLFEDNAEFGMGYRLSIDKHKVHAAELMGLLKDEIGSELVDTITNAPQTNEPEIFEQRARVKQMTDIVEKLNTPISRQLMSVADNLVKKSVWIMGGDGWAYDIGFGGLDHVLASGKDVNVLVLDTEVYSNTGGQKSKATPLGAVAKFAAGGKPSGKKDLGMIAMSYKNVYVASIAMGASDAQTVRALMEAEAYPGPSIVIAYSQCIAHGIDMTKGMGQQKLAVESAYWTLYRYNPLLAAEGKNPLKLDSKPPVKHVKEYSSNETRFTILNRIDPTLAEKYLEESDKAAKEKYDYYAKLAAISYDED